MALSVAFLCPWQTSTLQFSSQDFHTVSAPWLLRVQVWSQSWSYIVLTINRCRLWLQCQVRHLCISCLQESLQPTLSADNLIYRLLKLETSLISSLVSCQYCVLVNTTASWVRLHPSYCFHPLSTEVEPGFGSWEGSGWLFFEAVAESWRHHFCSFTPLLQELARFTDGASGV